MTKSTVTSSVSGTTTPLAVLAEESQEATLPVFLTEPVLPSGADVSLMIQYPDEILELLHGSDRWDKMAKKEKDAWKSNIVSLVQATLEFYKEYKSTVDRMLLDKASVTGKEVVVYDKNNKK